MSCAWLVPDFDDLPFLAGDAPGFVVPTPRRCRRHRWGEPDRLTGATACVRCGRPRDDVRVRRGRTNRYRGNSDELVVAKMLGGRKVGPAGHEWDVEVDGYLRLQAKRLDRWPSLNAIIGWLDAIPTGPHLRAVSLADTPGAGHRTRRLVVMDLDEYARWHGRADG